MLPTYPLNWPYSCVLSLVVYESTCFPTFLPIFRLAFLISFPKAQSGKLLWFPCPFPRFLVRGVWWAVARPLYLAPKLQVPQLDVAGELGGHSAQVQRRGGCSSDGVARISRSGTPGSRLGCYSCLVTQLCPTLLRPRGL